MREGKKRWVMGNELSKQVLVVRRDGIKVKAD